MRRAVGTNNNYLADRFLVQFQHKYMLETQFDYYRSTSWTCGVGSYSYDYECVYKKLDDISMNRTCTTPWWNSAATLKYLAIPMIKVAFFHCRVMSNVTKICESKDEVQRSFDEYINVTQNQLNTCKTSCKQMPITVTLIGKDESEQGKKFCSSTYCPTHRLS